MKSYLQWYITQHSLGCVYMDDLGIHQYAINSLQFTSAIRVPTKGYLPNTLITPRKLQEILAEVNKSLHHTNPDYTLV